MTPENKTENIIKPEILAPAGTKESLKAGIKAGADAVYVGGDLFSARAFAGNFGKAEMLDAIDYCHLYNAKLYMALNTLLKDAEISRVPEYIEPYYHAGIDGIIVQDMGVARVLSQSFPDLPLHGSTQMSISSRYGAQLLKGLGFTRVVPARELSLKEIISIKSAVDVEIETFVHGAMCFAYSGKCLLSSFIGGRSGNRGRCAQPCRQCYTVKAASESTCEYAMSMKDMCTLSHLPELIEAGIDSFKIEGRMKKPEYVASVVRSYKAAIDSYFSGSIDGSAISNQVQEMADIYNRGGFSSGYYYTQKSHDMLSVKRPNHTGVRVGKVIKVSPPDLLVKLSVDVTSQDVLEIRGKISSLELTTASGEKAGGILRLKGKEFGKISKGDDVYRVRNNALINEIQQNVIEPEEQLLVKANVEAHVGDPLKIRIFSAYASVEVCGNIVSKAETKPSSPERILEKMKKTGGTGIQFDCTVDVGPDAFVPMSELNNLRRWAAEEFKAKIAENFRRK